MDEVRDEMFDLLIPMDHIKTSPAAKEFRHETGYSEEETMEYMLKASTIGAVARINPISGEPNNLIIPKECLSVGLYKELEKFDLAKDIADQFANYYDKGVNANSNPYDCIGKSCRFCNDCESEHNETNHASKKPVKVIVNGKEGSIEEFLNILSDIPGGIEFLSNISKGPLCF